MRHRHSFENRYCCGCQCTTRHEIRESLFSCIRCGTVKYPTRLTKPAVATQTQELLRVHCA